MTHKIKISTTILKHLLTNTHITQTNINNNLQIYHNTIIHFPLNQNLLNNYNHTLINTQHFNNSLTFIKTQLQNYPKNIHLHKLQTKNFTNLNQKTQQHQTLTKIFTLQKQTTKTIKQLQLTQKTNNTNFYKSSTINTHLHKLKKQLLKKLKKKHN